ncbi:MAG: hypothetical protein ACYC9S_02375 [Leptospirales bacterium]
MEHTFDSHEKHVIREAKERGENALVDPMPDLTPDGVERWKENVKEYFMAECEEILEAADTPELKHEVINAMKEGFSALIANQPDVPIPDSGVETAHDAKEDAFHEIHHES